MYTYSKRTSNRCFDNKNTVNQANDQRRVLQVGLRDRGQLANVLTITRVWDSYRFIQFTVKKQDSQQQKVSSIYKFSCNDYFNSFIQVFF